MAVVHCSVFGKVKYIALVLGLALVLVGLLPAPTANAGECGKKPGKPEIQTPFANTVVLTRRVDLSWKSKACATHYRVEVRQNTAWGRPADASYNITDTHYRTRKLNTGQTYWWHVSACNAHGCSDSPWGRFTISE